ncbi:Flagellar motor rotation protein MotB [Minicystis rosea]|nr:Flagellar motor rotation protein MotB [Minicystis rosea]
MSAFEAEDESSLSAPVWPAFGDLMACLFGLFVLFFVWSVAFQVDLTHDLEVERARRAAEAARLEALERALAGPLADGRITLVDGRIGIRGSVLFGLNSAELATEGGALLGGLGAPLKAYLDSHDELIMVSGFTDDRPITTSPQGYRDNWELSAQRALTVTRALVAAGVPRDAVFAAGFGASHPVAPNDTADNRARNRRVEISPIPRRRSSP